MSDDRLLIENTKAMIMSDCIDIIFVTNREVVTYLRKKKTGYLPFFNNCNSKLSIYEAVSLAADELAKEGKVVQSGKKIRKPYSF